MTSLSTTTPTLLTRPTQGRPRCDGRRIAGVAVDADTAYEWRECEDCSYLWATPRGWAPQIAPTAFRAA